MYQEERLISIIDYLKEHKRISVEQICSLFGVSRDTARRDLVKLQEQGAIIRTRGGAILPTVHDEVKDYSGRLGMVSEEKSMIGKAAASLIREGDRMIWTLPRQSNHAPSICRMSIARSSPIRLTLRRFFPQERC